MLYKKLFKSITAITLVSALIIFSAVNVSAESVEAAVLDVQPANIKEYNMFDAQIVKGTSYDTSNLTLSQLPEYIVSNTDMYQNADNHPLSLNEENATDLYSFTTVNKDGTNTLYVFNDPIKYIDSDNSIKFIDNSIKKSNQTAVTSVTSSLSETSINAYKYENKANYFSTKMPETINQGISLTTDKFSFSMAPSVLSFSEGTLKTHSFHGVDEEVVEYRNVFGSGIHLQYVPTNSGIKENIVLDSYTGVNTFKFLINTGSYSPLYTEGEAIPFVDPSTEQIAFILGQVDARDSYVGDDTDGHFTLFNSISLSKVKSGSYVLTITVDADFLSDENTVYPVVIDPVVKLASGNIQDTTVYSLKSISQTFYSSSYNIVGYHNSSYGVGIAFIKTTSLSDYYSNFPTSDRIVYARYRVYEGSGKTSSATIQVHTPSASWSQSSITFSNMPSLSSATSSLTISKSGWYDFTVTSQVKAWVKELSSGTGTPESYGFALKASSNTASSRHFCSANYSGTYVPFVEIRYSPYTIHSVGTLSKYSTSDVQGEKDYVWGKFVTCGTNMYSFTVPESAPYEILVLRKSYNSTTATSVKLALYDSTLSEKYTSSTYQGSITDDGRYMANITATLSSGTYYVDLTDSDTSASGRTCYLIITCNNFLNDAQKLNMANQTKLFYAIGPVDPNYNCYKYAMGSSSAGDYPKDINELHDYLTGTAGYTYSAYYRANCIIVYATIPTDGSSSDYTSVAHFARVEGGKVTAKMAAGGPFVRHTSYDAYYWNTYGKPVAYYYK